MNNTLLFSDNEFLIIFFLFFKTFLSDDIIKDRKKQIKIQKKFYVVTDTDVNNKWIESYFKQINYSPLVNAV